MYADIVVNKISKAYDRVEVIRGISLETKNDAPSVILGPSGCGKSTLLRLIAGLEIPDEGEILFNGRIVSTPRWVLEPYRRDIGFVFQNSALWPHMTIRKNIQFGMRAFSKFDSLSFTTELMRKLGINDLAERYPGQVSGGQARRAAIARALAVKPRLLLMDEPLTNIEQELKYSILEYILEFMQDTGACMIYVTHDPDEASRIGGKIHKMKDGNFE
jgi:iron(III) transport system ATP-binding protein